MLRDGSKVVIRPVRHTDAPLLADGFSRLSARSRQMRFLTRKNELTPAELRLLPYLQTHLTIGEIGERLFVSRNTVSSQVTSIYRKLGVSSRNDAVTQATTVGLLGG